jgi:hypothetical protein
MFEGKKTQSRRDMLYRLGGVCAGLAASGSVQSQTQVSKKIDDYPPDVNRKFYPDGRVMPFAGNTIICHADQQGDRSAYFYALLDIYREAQGLDFMRKVTLLPPSSYHMTLFGGANDKGRKPGLWPSFVPLDASMEACNQAVAERLKNFQLDCELPLRMKVDPAPPSEKPFTLRLLPVDAAEAAKLKRLRDRLSEVLGIREPGHDSYRFHTTLGYALRWLTSEENEQFQALMKKWRTSVAERCPVITFGAPEYCLLDDMYAFRRQFFLQ